ncbi:MAG TPA: hypothetical protein VK400_14760 [Pyrinomonadaceae bacterium]|nr:hypothetical protein [Pyrinomonadaceae bacterium]
MMNKFIRAICLSIVLSVAVFAQTDDSDEYNRNEFYVGYSHQQVDEGSRRNLNGFEGSFTRNVKRYVGIRGMVSGAYESTTLQGAVPSPAGGSYEFRQDFNRSVYNFLGGVQFKDNASKARFKPFAFALGGVAVNRARFKNFACTSGNCPTGIPVFNNTTFTDTGVAGSFGGGLDIKINDKIDFRAVQVDYNPIYSNSRVDNNFRIGVGFVFK